MPDWAAQPSDTSTELFPAPLDASYTAVASDGYPTRQDCALHNWPSYYQTKGAASAFEALYDNQDGLLDAWGQFWAQLARATVASPDRSAVIGYELINEP